MNFAIGVDGGGTWTRAVVVDQDGHELGRGETEGAVVPIHEPIAAAEAVRQAVDRALVNTNLTKCMVGPYLPRQPQNCQK